MIAENTSYCFPFLFSDIDECHSGPCQNAGYCKNLLNHYKCNCLPGYEGDNCEIGKCLSCLLFLSTYFLYPSIFVYFNMFCYF